jgi:predicted nucleic acid-binding protein
MSIIYLDTSALIKRYIQEPGSDLLNTSWPSFSVIGCAVIVYVEVAAAFSKATRMGWLQSDTARRVWQTFLGDWQKLTLVNISFPVVHRAGALAWDHGLRGYDAIHLAAALIWQEGMGEAIQLATFDRHLWNAARQVNLTVWPESLL